MSLERPERGEFAFLHPMRVRWSEVDPQSIVFNANYFMYFDVAITEYWRRIGYPYPDGFLALGCDTFAKAASAEWHASARFDEEIDVGVRVARLGRSSMRLLLGVSRGEELLVTGELIYVFADAESRRPIAIPQAIRQAAIALETTPPEGV